MNLTATTIRSPFWRLENLNITFNQAQVSRHVVSNLDMEVCRGECVALVGESGSGKTVTCLATLGLLRGAKISGRLFLEESVFDLSTPRELPKIRGRRVAMLPQNFSGSLNPVRTIGAQMVDIIRFHHDDTKHGALERAISLLEELGVSTPEKRLRQFPHQQSGGIQQRIALAIVLSCQPELLITDEPTSALDVTSQYLLLKLLKNIMESKYLALLLVSHNLAVVGNLANRIYVLSNGSVVETGSTTKVLSHPVADTTIKLLHATRSMALP